jgi:hypothetical protein
LQASNFEGFQKTKYESFRSQFDVELQQTILLHLTHDRVRYETERERQKVAAAQSWSEASLVELTLT